MLFKDIETERLILRSISYEDREFILKEFSDEAVTRYLYDEEPMKELSDAEEIIEFYTQPEPRGQHRWILTLKSGGEKIGTCGFHRWEREEKRVEIGYDMQEAYWGHGYMTEAMKAIIAFGVNEMGISRIDAHIYAGNTKSVNIAKRCGFACEGGSITYTFRGKEYPHDIYTLHTQQIQ